MPHTSAHRLSEPVLISDLSQQVASFPFSPLSPVAAPLPLPHFAETHMVDFHYCHMNCTLTQILLCHLQTTRQQVPNRVYSHSPWAGCKTTILDSNLFTISSALLFCNWLLTTAGGDFILQEHWATISKLLYSKMWLHLDWRSKYF